MATALEQLRYIDEQLANAALPSDQAELVRVHRLTGLQLRNQRLQELGPAPQADTAEYSEWEKCKKELEHEVDMSLAETRLSVEGLEESWEKWLHIEKLKAVREQLLQQTASEGLMPGSKHDQQLEGTQAISVSASPGQMQEAAAWESLQIAPLASPGAWDAQQQQVQQHMQQMQGHLQVQPGHEQAQVAGIPDAQQDPHQVHLQQQWQAMGHAQVMGQPAQPQTAPNPEGVPMKHCRRCNTHKPITQFYKSKANADGYDGRCKTCDAVQCAQRRKRKERVENPTVEWKTCRRCKVNKAAADFYRNKTNADGLYNNCKACFSQDAQHRRERLPPLEERTAAAKQCRRCKETKPAAEFYKNKHMSDGLYTHCKACYTDAANQRSAGRAPAETKRCRRCGNTKEAADFYVSKMTADGLQSYCKACYAVASAARRTRNSQEAELQAHKDVDEYGVQHQVMQDQVHLLQGGMVDSMGQQVMGLSQLQAGLDPAQLQQLGYDPSVMQATLEHHGLSHLEHGGHHGLEHHHAALEHHALQHPQHHLEHQALQQAHHHLDHTGAEYQSHTGLEHHGLEHQAHDHQLHDHQAYSHAQAALTHHHEHTVM